ARHRRELPPTAVCPLRSEQFSSSLPDDLLAHFRPFETQELKRPILVALRLGFHQPAGSTLSRFFILGALRLRGINLDRAHRNSRDLDVARFERVPRPLDPPVSVRRLPALQIAGGSAGSGIGRVILSRHSKQNVTYGVLISGNSDVLQEPLAPG